MASATQVCESRHYAETEILLTDEELSAYFESHPVSGVLTSAIVLPHSDEKSQGYLLDHEGPESSVEGGPLVGQESLDPVDSGGPINTDPTADPSEPIGTTLPETSGHVDEEAVTEVNSVDKLKEQTDTIQKSLRMLQNGLLAKGQQLAYKDMGQLSSALEELENFDSVSAVVTLSSSIARLLKGIGKMKDIPRDSELHLTKRANSLYQKLKENREKQRLEETRGGKSVDKQPVDSLVGMHPPEKLSRSDLDPRPSTSPCAALHPTKTKSQPVLIDLTDEEPLEVVTSPDIASQQARNHSTEPDTDQKIRERAILPPLNTGIDQVAARNTVYRNRPTPKTPQKRKRVNDEKESRLHKSNPRTTANETPAHKIATRRLSKRQKTSPQEHLDNEIGWMSGTVRSLRKLIVDCDNEINAIKEQMQEKMKPMENRKAELIKMMESLKAWGAQDQEVTGQWCSDIDGSLK